MKWWSVFASTWVVVLVGCGGVTAFEDAGGPDATPDLQRDREAGADLLDMPGPDTLPDKALPDKALPDTAQPDAQSDKALSDKALPDKALPDKALPDLPLADANPPDQTQPDLGTKPGTVYTLAGTGKSGSDNGPVAKATFFAPYGVAVASNGDVYVTDVGNDLVRRISGGVVSTHAGAGTPKVFDSLRGIVVDGADTLYVADVLVSKVFKIVKGKATVHGSGFNYPVGLALTSGKELYVSNEKAGTVVALSAGVIKTTVTGFNHPHGVFVDSKGQVYVADSAAHRLSVFTGKGPPKVLAGSGTSGDKDGPALTAEFHYPTSVVVDSGGKIYVSERLKHRIRFIANGQVGTLTGTGKAKLVDGPLSTAQFNLPSGLALDQAGKIYVADEGNHCIRVIVP